ncbi:uncharacterized protein [Hemitrygon akajei]|uniref:uncharacterized protein n=1 Tax=Hemitrygon akajei TaxID=2704970 RepID=UPI003BF975AC
MDDSETYMKKKPRKTGSLAPSRDQLTSTYTELNIRKVERLTNTQTDGLDPTYSQLNFRQNELPIAKDDDPPIASRPGEMPVTAQAAAEERESKVKIGNRPYRLICLLCLVTAALIVIVVGLSIYVSQIPQSPFTSDRNYHELNSTLQSKLSALNSNLSDLNRMHSDLRHQFTKMETKYRSVNETKAQICELLTSRREQMCSEDWATNKDRCYFVSTFETSFRRAIQECSNRDSWLLEINSRDEASFVPRSVPRNYAYWIGQCANGNVDFGRLYKLSSAGSSCSVCKSRRRGDNCLHYKHRFICEKSAHSRPDIPERIQVLCQQPGEPT